VGVLNEGIAGNRTLHDSLGPNALARFDRDTLASTGVTHVIVQLGGNDIFTMWLANCYFASRRACNIVTFCRRVSAA
jgi:hypothetical protein